ncbi:hypothetical protein ERJ75_000691000 [Trypanosoma vivax]|nr:hypothetical protein ERJ75_000691000 [Trypanosoma vivax]
MPSISPAMCLCFAVSSLLASRRRLASRSTSAQNSAAFSASFLASAVRPVHSLLAHVACTAFTVASAVSCCARSAMLLHERCRQSLRPRCAAFSALDTPHAACAFASFTAFSWLAPHRATHNASNSHNLPQKQAAVPSPIIVPSHSCRSVPVTKCECWLCLALASPKRAPPAPPMVALSVLPPRPSDRARGKALRRPFPATRVRDLAPARCALSANGVASVSDHELRCARVDWAGLAAQPVPYPVPLPCPGGEPPRVRRARAAALTRASGWQRFLSPVVAEDAARSTEARRLALVCAALPPVCRRKRDEGAAR